MAVFHFSELISFSNSSISLLKTRDEFFGFFGNSLTRFFDFDFGYNQKKMKNKCRLILVRFEERMIWNLMDKL
ncbi:hypothetical protein M0811_13566 [Anaeramoeba ignava]|uniref:Uncharacterized protein n=1 Tax=Anaeramoeba ignava TaxID=1746090 RepID=A0A9Q0L5Q5_ANAIG|nr:hypothetical protein M0811_13566 [Anaeramoeba ignava]